MTHYTQKASLWLLSALLLGLVAWQPVAAQSAQRVALDLALVRRQLLPAGPATARRGVDPTYRLRLPTLRGPRPFVLRETHILPAADAAAQRRLRTFVGVEEGAASHRVAVVLTPRRFTAQVLAGEESASLRPADDGTGSYLLQPTPPTEGPCGTQAPPSSQRLASTSTQPAPFSFGTQLRRLRYAILVTQEYYSANGNTEVAVEQAVVTAMNQMSALYSAELSVSYELVKPIGGTYYFSGMATLTLPGSAGPAPGQLHYQNLGEVGDLINTRFDPNTFDLGHCFHPDGGGIARVGVICNYPYKAQGWSGVTPWGFQNTLAHEMGHQHGASHTFNGPCGSGRLGANLEPGGGATIMAYTYVCGGQNLWDVPRGEAAHFNLVSLDQMRGHLQNVGCPVITPNANRPPTLSAGADYVIPRNTPFTLTATGADPDGDQLAYTWNQFDYNENWHALGSELGVRGLAAIDDPEAPLFRPRPPRPAPSRTFPDLRYILANGNRPDNRIGEALPNVGRELHFAVTARDQRPTGGTFTTDNVTLTVAPGTGPFMLTVQNDAPSLWVVGQAVAVTWAVNGTDRAPIGTTQVRLTLSTDGGQSFPTVLAASVPNTGAATITVPNLPTSRARLRVEALGNIFFDINDTDFILAPCQPATAQMLPADALSATAGDAVLNLGQNLYSLTELTGPNQPAGVINSTNPTSTLTRLENGGCINYSNVTFYQAHVFVPSVTDVYTIDTPVGFGNMVLRVYEGDAFQPWNPCQNLLADNMIRGFLPRSVRLPLTAGLVYTLVVSSYSGSLPSNGAYRVTFSPQAGTGKVYAPLPRIGYETQYVTINLADNTVAQVAPSADLRGLAAGTYAVQGLLVQRGYPTAGFAGRSLGSLQADLAAVSPCGQLSTNIRRVTVVGKPLPVQLVSFTGQPAGAANNLRWTTASEANVAHFDLERSPDGQAFAAIGRAPATNRTTAHNYLVADTTPPTGVAYYRLRVQENDGSATYSSTVALTRAAANQAGLLVTAYPNPVPSSVVLRLKVESPAAQRVELHVADALGRRVLSRAVLLAKGPNLLAVPEASQWHGLYILTVQTATDLHTHQKLVLE